MLVLSRQRDETIMIGDEVEVTVVDIRGDKVRLGISAPREVSVHRKEVYDAIKRENQAAAQVRVEDLPGSAGAPSGGAAGPRAAGDGGTGGPLRPTIRAAVQAPRRPGQRQRGPRRPEGAPPELPDDGPPQAEPAPPGDA